MTDQFYKRQKSFSKMTYNAYYIKSTELIALTIFMIKV